MPLTPQELRQRRLALLATSAKAAPDAKALLDAANSASQTVAVLHVAFMAVCAYVLVIVFGTTDLDLLMGGNNVKLPVIDVAVPILGFYAVAPYLVVLMHLNLLLQLQLLSRKLFAFDAATPADESVGGLRDRLHIFPYTYYLVGRPGVVVGGLLGLVVSVSLVVLPLATLLALQLKFLAYQAEGITWAQRIAVFLDVGLLVALWPVILHPRDDWKAWWRETLAAYLPNKRAWLAVVVLVASLALILFAATPDIFTVGLILGAVAPLLLIVLVGHFSDERIRRAILLFAALLGLLAVLWALIWRSRDDWQAWWRETLAAYLPNKGVWLAVIELLASVALILFAATPDIFTVGLILGAVAPLLLIVLVGHFSDERIRRAILLFAALLGLLAVLWALIWRSTDSLPVGPATPVALFLAALPLAFFWHPKASRGSLALLWALALTPLLTLGLMVDGEIWEVATAEVQRPLLDWQMLGRQEKTLAEQFENDGCRSIGQTLLSCVILAEQRRLDLNERALFAKPPNPELLAALRAGKGLENKDKLERISLAGRSLRRAQMQSALLVGADLRGAQLQGAIFSSGAPQLQGAISSQLQGADLSGAQLQGADLSGVQLQGAILWKAQLQGADLGWASLQGADLGWASLQRAVLGRAQFQGADLMAARLQGADLRWASLQGANLNGAQLQGMSLMGAGLEGADLGAAGLQFAVLDGASLQGADLSEAQLQGASLGDSTFYRNGNPAQSDLLDMRGTVVKPLSSEDFSAIQTVLKSISFRGKEDSLQRLKRATRPGAAVPIFDSCITNITDRESQPKCNQVFDATDLDQRSEFARRLHELLVTLACEDVDTAQGVLFGHIPELSDESAGLATVLLARMKANQPCMGLTNLPAEDKADLEQSAKEEAEQERAAKAAGADQR